MDGGPKRRGRRPVEELTDSQRRVLREIQDFIAQRDFPPTGKELASRLGISTATAHEQIGQLVRKGYLRREPRKARGIFLARIPDDRPADLAPLPLLGTVPAGSPLLAEENILGEVWVDRKLVASGRCFALQVTGESMRDASINDGDMVIVRQQPVAENGDIVVALLDDEATVKRLSIRDHEIELRPENPKFRSMQIGPEHELRIVGKVIAVRRGGGLPDP
jgi:repressor LexA